MNVKANEARKRLDKVAARLLFHLQIRVCERAEREITGWKGHVERCSFVMDLNSIPELDYKLLAAPELDFSHDCCGIRQHMDRSTYPGKLTDCFWPRCCKSEEDR